MAIVYSENVIEIAAVALYGGRPAVNVWHMGYRVEAGDPSLTDVVGDFRDNWQDHILTGISDQYAIDRFEWRSLDPADASVGVVQPDSAKPLVGTQTSTAFPPNVALLLHKNTANRPRGRRDGRCYLPGFVEDGAGADGVLDPAYVTSWDTRLATFFAGISDTSTFAWGDSFPVVLETTAASRTAGATPVTIGSREVTSITVDGRLATQRDRLR